MTYQPRYQIFIDICGPCPTIDFMEFIRVGKAMYCKEFEVDTSPYGGFHIVDHDQLTTFLQANAKQIVAHCRF